MASEFVPHRSLLRFADEVKSRFAFLETLGFRCVRSEVNLVRFVSSKFAISIYHGNLSYEISSAIESVRGSDGYSFFEVLCLVKSERVEQYLDYTSHTVEGVAEGVRRLAKLFREFVAAGILNDSELFSRLKVQRDEWAKNYALETQLVQARKKSDVAWKERDFGEVVQILISLREHLNPSDLKKLEYAIKRSNA